jgi:hypothetical protein
VHPISHQKFSRLAFAGLLATAFSAAPLLAQAPDRDSLSFLTADFGGGFHTELRDDFLLPIVISGALGYSNARWRGELRATHGSKFGFEEEPDQSMTELRAVVMRRFPFEYLRIGIGTGISYITNVFTRHYFSESAFKWLEISKTESRIAVPIVAEGMIEFAFFGFGAQLGVIVGDPVSFEVRGVTRLRIPLQGMKAMR